MEWRQNRSPQEGDNERSGHGHRGGRGGRREDDDGQRTPHRNGRGGRGGRGGTPHTHERRGEDRTDDDRAAGGSRPYDSPGTQARHGHQRGSAHGRGGGPGAPYSPAPNHGGPGPVFGSPSRPIGGGGGGGSGGGFQFAAHMGQAERLDGIRAGKVLVGYLRINARKPRLESYVAVSGLAKDVFIEGEIDRNRALEGDLVAIELYPAETWSAVAVAGSAAADTDGATPAPDGADDLVSGMKSMSLKDGTAIASTGIIGEEGEVADEVSPQQGIAAVMSSSVVRGDAGVVPRALPSPTRALASVPEDKQPALPPAAAAALTTKLWQPMGLPSGAASKPGTGGEGAAADDGIDLNIGRAGISKLPSDIGAAVSSPSYRAAIKAIREQMSSTPDDDDDREGADGAAGKGDLASPAPTPGGGRTPGRTPGRRGGAGGRGGRYGERAIVTRDDIDGPSILQPRGRVVSIITFGHPRKAVGTLRPFDDSHNMDTPIPERVAYLKLVPLDAKIPWLIIPRTDVPEADRGIFVKPSDYAMRLFSCSLGRWNDRDRFPTAHLDGSLGEAGEIGSETAAILYSHGVRDQPFSDEVMASLEEFERDIYYPPVTPEDEAAGKPRKKIWRIPEAEVKKRYDFRHLRICTVDPTTAKDLDDALHITPLGDDVYELGVHIADVSHFVKPDSALDHEAGLRATSVYLVQRVIPMLPSLLCEELCSLNPGVDRLAFSCVWRMKGDGTLLEDSPPLFCRSIIRSVAKLDYATAQRMIENEITEEMALNDDVAAGRIPAAAAPAGAVPSLIPAELWDPLRRPPLETKRPEDDPEAPLVQHGCLDVVKDIKLMAKIALARRRKRFAAGALQLNRGKIVLQLDRETGNPIGVGMYPIKDSNRMVEEMMLLANYLVAAHLAKTCGPGAVLRCHPPIMADKCAQVVALAKAMGYADFSVKSAGDIHNSLLQVYARDPEAGKVLENMVTKPMQPAQYFLTGDQQDVKTWAHFALAIPVYTHFTSPIRRMADVMVHRLLAMAIEKEAAEKPALATRHIGSRGRTVFTDEPSRAGAAIAAEAPRQIVDLSKERLSELSAQCAVCNEKKMLAKQAQEASDIVYFSVFLRDKGPMECEAIVLDVGGTSFFTVVVPALDLERKVYFDRCGLVATMSDAPNCVLVRRATQQELLMGSSGGNNGKTGFTNIRKDRREANAAGAPTTPAQAATPAPKTPATAAGKAKADGRADGEDSDGEGAADATAALAAQAGLSKRRLREIVKWVKRHRKQARELLGLDLPEAAEEEPSREAVTEAIRALIAARGAEFFASAAKAAETAASAGAGGKGRGAATPAPATPATPAPAPAVAATPVALPAAPAAAAGAGAVAPGTVVIQRKGAIPQVVPGAKLFPSETGVASTGRHADPSALAFEYFTLRPMSKLKAQLVAVMDRVPIDVDVQLIQLLRE